MLTINSLAQVLAHGDRALQRILWTLVHSQEPKVVVEIGTGPGSSTRAIAVALREIKEGLVPGDLDWWPEYEGHLWSVDYSDLVGGVFVELEIMGLRSFVTRVKDYSEKAALYFELPVDMLLIDGDHSYSAVRKDWFAWYPLLHKGSVVILHDLVIGEVDKAYKELALGYESIRIGISSKLTEIGVIKL